MCSIAILIVVLNSLAWASPILLHFWATMSLCNNTSGCIVAGTVSCSLSVVFIIVVALGVLVFFKMYRKFIYRLLLYAFVAMITAMFGLTAYLLTIIIVQGQQVEFETFTNNSIIIINIFYYIYTGSIFLSFLLLTSMSLCIYILAIHHHQFTSWVADLIFLLVCLILSQLTAITIQVIAISLPYQSPWVLPIQ